MSLHNPHLIWLVLAVGLGLRLVGIADHPAWIDEANGLLIASTPPGTILDKLQTDSSPPLHYLVLHYWMLVFGDSPTSVRGLSTLFSLGLIAATCHAGRRFVSPTAGLLAGLYLATCSSQVFYSQQARMYTLLPLLALTSTLCLLAFLQRPRRGWLIAYGALTLGALYTHNFALFLPPAHVVIVAANGALRRHLGSWLAVGAAVALGYLPWFGVFLDQLENGDHYAWFAPFWREAGPFGMLWNSIQSTGPACEMIYYAGVNTEEFGSIPAAVTALLAAAGAWHVCRRRRTESEPVHSAWPLWLWAAPVTVALLASALFRPGFVAGRVDQMMLPAWALLVGAGIDTVARLAPNAGARVAVGAVLALGGAVIGAIDVVTFRPAPTAETPNGDENDLARDLAAQVRPGDGILFTSLSRAPIEYGLRQHGALPDTRITLRNFPRSTAAHLGNQNDVRLATDPAALRREATAVVTELDQALAPDASLFVVFVLPRGPIGRETLAVNRHLSELLESGRAKGMSRVGVYEQAGTWLVITVVRCRL